MGGGSSRRFAGGGLAPVTAAGLEKWNSFQRAHPDHPAPPLDG